MSQSRRTCNPVTTALETRYYCFAVIFSRHVVRDGLALLQRQLLLRVRRLGQEEPIRIAYSMPGDGSRSGQHRRSGGDGLRPQHLVRTAFAFLVKLPQTADGNLT